MPIVGLSTSWSLYSVEAQGLWTSGPRQPAVVLRGVGAMTSHNLRRHVALIPFGARSVGKASAVPAVPVSCAESQGHGTHKGPRLARFRPNGRVDHSDRRWCASLVRAKNVRLGGTARSAGAPTRPGSPCFCWISGGWSERCHSALGPGPPAHGPSEPQESDRIGHVAGWRASDAGRRSRSRGRSSSYSSSSTGHGMDRVDRIFVWSLPCACLAPQSAPKQKRIRSNQHFRLPPQAEIDFNLIQVL